MTPENGLAQSSMKRHVLRPTYSDSIGIREIAETIKQMELELGLFKDSTYGRDARLVWEACRFRVSEELRRRFAGHSAAQAVSVPPAKLPFVDLMRVLSSMAYSATLKNPFFARSGRPYLFFPGARRTRNSHGEFFNRLTDPIIPLLGQRKTNIIERPDGRKHYLPPVNGPVWHSEGITLLTKLIKQFYGSGYVPSLYPLSARVQNYLRNTLSVDLDVYSILTSVARSLLAARNVYRMFLRRLRPTWLILVCSYGLESLILAAKDLGITTIELQHGVITQQHLGYSFPEGMTKLSFPDYLFVYGKFWKESVSYPIQKSHIHVIGYGHLEVARERYRMREKRRQITVVSQATIGRQLSRFVVELSKILPQNYRVVYKLHPGETQSWRSRYPWLQEAAAEGRMDIAEHNQVELFELLAESQWVLGVYSTAIVEGILFNCTPILVELPGVEYLEPLVEAGIAHLVSKPEEIDLSHTVGSLEARYFFEPDWKRCVYQAFVNLQ